MSSDTIMNDSRPNVPPLSIARYTDSRENGRLSEGGALPRDLISKLILAELDERFLLTPPAVDVAPPNPFDYTNISELASHSPTQLSRLLEQNAKAFRQNAFVSTSRNNSPPDGEATNMLKNLQLKTDFSDLHRTGSAGSMDSYTDSRLRSSTSAGSLPLRIPSVRNRLHSTAGSVSPGSVISSPMLAAMLDITPLPSPIMGPSEWRALAKSRSRASSTASRTDLPPAVLPTISPRKKGYGVLHINRKSSLSDGTAAPSDKSKESARSVSEYVAEHTSSSRPRNISVGLSVDTDHTSPALQREDFLGVRRGIVSEPKSGPTSNGKNSLLNQALNDEPSPKRVKVDAWAAQSINTGTTKYYDKIKPLGQGTFSKVYLAVRQMHDNRSDSVDYRQPSVDMAGVRARSRRLVAIKVVEPGPAGGADAERIEVSLKREVELMKKVQHPCIIHLKAFGTEPGGRALLVMNYCPGGDLFDLASTQLNVLTPPLVRRIFSELVSAVRFLHQKYIVHRDIKLENVLLNIPVQVHSDVPDWQNIDRAVITLTDLGLSRSIPPPPESPLLETRCGSEDYAAPEILMGQPYDGRQTDAWALGVLLYAMLEGRLPFDPLPNARGDPATLRARIPHRIARCEWSWVKYGDEDGDWDSTKGKGFDGAMKCVDALLKRNTRRKPLSEIRDWPWVRDGIQVDGGLRWVEEEGM